MPDHEGGQIRPAPIALKNAWTLHQKNGLFSPFF